MLKARGNSLSAKFLLFFGFLELLLLAGGLYAASKFLAQDRIQATRQLLLSQVDLIAKQVELDRTRLNELQLHPNLRYQVVDFGGRVSFDSRDSGRVNRQIVGGQPLFDAARNSPAPHGLHEFQSPQNSLLYFGAFAKVADQHLVLGAISVDSVDLDVLLVLERFLVLGLLVWGASLVLLAPIFKWMARTREVIEPAALEPAIEEAYEPPPVEEPEPKPEPTREIPNLAQEKTIEKTIEKTAPHLKTSPGYSELKLEITRTGITRPDIKKSEDDS